MMGRRIVLDFYCCGRRIVFKEKEMTPGLAVTLGCWSSFHHLGYEVFYSVTKKRSSSLYRPLESFLMIKEILLSNMIGLKERHKRNNC